MHLKQKTNTQTVLQCTAKLALQAAVYAMTYPSVHPSVTLRYCVKTREMTSCQEREWAYSFLELWRLHGADKHESVNTLVVVTVIQDTVVYTDTIKNHLNEVGQQSTAQLLLQDLTVPVDEVTAWDQSRKQNVHEPSITEVWKRQWAKLLQHSRWLSRLNHHLSTCTHISMNMLSVICQSAQFQNRSMHFLSVQTHNYGQGKALNILQKLVLL